MRTQMNYYGKILIVASILGSLLACSAQPPVPEDNFYQLPKAQLQTSKHSIVNELSVKRLVTDGLHSERALLFSQSDKALQLKQYHYHHWSDSPPRMIQEHLISALRNAGIADTVVNYDAAQRAAYNLSGKIRHFEQTQRGKKNEVLVGVELRLDDRNGKPLLIKDYQYAQVANSSAPHDLVNAFGEALNKIYAEFISDWMKR